ncbi:hypothetical protein V8F33_001050 [Rhypophila sp. PSN 637]
MMTRLPKLLLFNGPRILRALGLGMQLSRPVLSLPEPSTDNNDLRARKSRLRRSKNIPTRRTKTKWMRKQTQQILCQIHAEVQVLVQIYLPLRNSVSRTEH